MPRSILIITAVDAEARAIDLIDGVRVQVGGIGRTNAACATTEAILRARDRAPVDAVISAGVAGSLPGSELNVGDVIVASSCVYAEEGIVTSGGFAGVDGLGFALGDFEGNAVPVDHELLDLLSPHFPIGPIATVATCSGTDEAAASVTRRTGAMAEAMEGAAVVHAARRLGVPAIEIRAISNYTGDRAHQQWDLPRAFDALGRATRTATQQMQTSSASGT